MADLEARVAVLEREMAVVKERTGRHDEELANIPELIKVEFRLANSRTARLAQDVADFKTDADLRLGRVEARLTGLERKFDEFPKVVADVVREVLNAKDRQR